MNRSSKKASQQVVLFLRLFRLSGQECECMKILTRSNIAYWKQFNQNLVRSCSNSHRTVEQPPLLPGIAAAGAAAGCCHEAAGVAGRPTAARPGAQLAQAEHCGQSL